MTAFLALGWPIAAFCAWRWHHDRKCAWRMVEASRQWEALHTEVQQDRDEWREAAETWMVACGLWQATALQSQRITHDSSAVLN